MKTVMVGEYDNFSLKGEIVKTINEVAASIFEINDTRRFRNIGPRIRRSKLYKPNGLRECERRFNQIRNKSLSPFGTIVFAGATLKSENGYVSNHRAMREALDRRYAKGLV